MQEDQLGPSAIFARGGRMSLIRSFEIQGLYGYRNIGLNSKFAATILIAKNGTGKTTLLGALDAFLRMQLGRLRDLEFDCIRCELAGVDDELYLSHDEVIEFLQLPTDGELTKVASRCGMEPRALFEYIIDDYQRATRDERFHSDSKVGAAIRQGFSYNYAEAEATLERLTEALFSRQENVRRCWTAVRRVLRDYEVVYLPTYRRIELALTEEYDPGPYRRRRGPKLSVAAGSLYTGDIQFGLADISDRLSTLNNQITYASNNGYRELSANIINELIDGSFERETVSSHELPSRDELEIFFSRLKDVRQNVAMPSVVTPKLETLFGDQELPESSRKFLNYFLKQLGAVITATKDVEAPVDAFVASCNKYLLSSEPSTTLDLEDGSRIVDGKILKLTRRNLRVHVETVPEGRKISLNALSSGEKQMISLFAKLFLYPKKKIVLIDEPELSLSIDWQSQILVDVLKAPLCEQIIAITHSPFVFDNELDPFAQPLIISRSANPSPAGDELPFDIVEDFDDE